MGELERNSIFRIQQQSIELVEWPSALARSTPSACRYVAPIDLAGPARRIFDGPPFDLPAGAWTAEVIFDVTECLSDNRIEVEIFAAGVISAVKAKLPASGVHSCELRFEIVAPTRPVEVRIQLLAGAIEGRLLVRQITFQREHERL